MLDSLFDSIKGNVLDTVMEKAGITTEQAEQVVPVAKETVETGLMEQVKSGNISGILDMFNTKQENLESNDLFGSLKGMLMQNVITKVGLPASVAGLVSGSGLQSMIGNLSGLLGGGDGQVTKESLMDKIDMGDLAGNLLKDKLGGFAKGLFGK